MINDRKYSNKTKLEERRELEKRYRQNKKSNEQLQFKSFGFYDFLFFFIIIIISVLCKVLDFSFNNF